MKALQSLDFQYFLKQKISLMVELSDDVTVTSWFDVFREAKNFGERT